MSYETCLSIPSSSTGEYFYSLFTSKKNWKIFVNHRVTMSWSWDPNRSREGCQGWAAQKIASFLIYKRPNKAHPYEFNFLPLPTNSKAISQMSTKLESILQYQCNKEQEAMRDHKSRLKYKTREQICYDTIRLYFCYSWIF